MQPRRVLDRIGSPDDVAGAILYLAGAQFVTGTTIVVDGGRLLQTGLDQQCVVRVHGHCDEHRPSVLALRA